MLEIDFYIGEDKSTRKLPLKSETDRAIRNARKILEEEYEVKFEIDHRHGFPSFTLYRDGKDIGGG